MRRFIAVVALSCQLVLPFMDGYLINAAESVGQGWISKVQADCELEALSVGTRLADRYNSLDEATEWDTRIHHDYLTKYLGFAGWIQIGVWKNTQLTAFRQHAPTLHKVRTPLMLILLELFIIYDPPP